MLDWGMCGTIVAVIAFGYSIWVEHKLKKLNDHVAALHKMVLTKITEDHYEFGDN